MRGEFHQYLYSTLVRTLQKPYIIPELLPTDNFVYINTTRDILFSAPTTNMNPKRDFYQDLLFDYPQGSHLVLPGSSDSTEVMVGPPVPRESGRTNPSRPVNRVVNLRLLRTFYVFYLGRDLNHEYSQYRFQRRTFGTTSLTPLKRESDSFSRLVKG